jgi:acyl-CoA reductase-like NAD-dependent aldehyde dehydrogenase
VFGPVLTMLTFDSPEEAVRIANGTEYGLTAGVYTKDLKLAHWTADRLQAARYTSTSGMRAGWRRRSEASRNPASGA